MIKGFLITIGLALLLFVVMIYLGQNRLIYFPRSYNPLARELQVVDRVRFETPQGAQNAYLYPRRESGAPEKVWWLFGGNGSTALDWLAILGSSEVPPGVVFVLVDYPGYGFNEGRPGPESIAESIDRLYEKLCLDWRLTSGELSARSAVLGHSLGSAVALDVAARHGMREAVAVSPFTSMKDMAKLKFGWLHHLLAHQFDNRSAIRRLNEKETGARIQIFHGGKDRLIPVSMGRELWELTDGKAQFNEIPGSGHNDILFEIQGQLAAILMK